MRAFQAKRDENRRRADRRRLDLRSRYEPICTAASSGSQMSLFAVVRLQARWRARALARRRSIERQLREESRLRLEQAERDAAAAIAMAENIARSTQSKQAELDSQKAALDSEKAQLDSQKAELAALRKQKQEWEATPTRPAPISRHQSSRKELSSPRRRQQRPSMDDALALYYLGDELPSQTHPKPLPSPPAGPAPGPITVNEGAFVPPPPDSPPPASSPLKPLGDEVASIGTPAGALQLSVRLLKSATRLFMGGRPSPDSQTNKPPPPTHVPRTNRAAELRIAAAATPGKSTGSKHQTPSVTSPNLISFKSPGAPSPATSKSGTPIKAKRVTPSSRTPGISAAAASPQPGIGGCTPPRKMPSSAHQTPPNRRETNRSASGAQHTHPIVPVAEMDASTGPSRGGAGALPSRLPKPPGACANHPRSGIAKPAGRKQSLLPSAPTLLAQLSIPVSSTAPQPPSMPASTRRASMLPPPGVAALSARVSGSISSILSGPSHLPIPTLNRLSGRVSGGGPPSEFCAVSGSKKVEVASGSDDGISCIVNADGSEAAHAEPSAYVESSTHGGPGRGLPPPRVVVDSSKKLQAFNGLDSLGNKENEEIAAAISATSSETA